MNNNRNISKSICNRCEFRFRRVFIPSHPEDYLDENGDTVLTEDTDNIIIMNICTISDMDLDTDSTIECSHYKAKCNKQIPFFRNSI